MKTITMTYEEYQDVLSLAEENARDLSDLKQDILDVYGEDALNSLVERARAHRKSRDDILLRNALVAGKI